MGRWNANPGAFSEMPVFTELAAFVSSNSRRARVFRSLPMHKMTNTDIGRIMRSQEIQKALRAPK